MGKRREPLARIELFRSMFRLGPWQFSAFIVTVVAIVFTDLLLGITLGLIVGLFNILQVNYRTNVFLEHSGERRYTVRLTVKGPHGEDVEEKKRFVHVQKDGNNGGGGSGARSGSNPRMPQPQGSSPNNPGRLLGDRSARPKVQTLPTQIKPHAPGKGVVDKVVNIFDESPDGTGAAREVPLQSVLPGFQRAAEEAMERERIPPARRELIRSYYEEMPGK